MKKLLAIVFTILAMLAVSLSFGENTGGDNGKIVGTKGDDPKPLPPEQKPLPPKPTLPAPTPRPEPKPMPAPSK